MTQEAVLSSHPERTLPHRDPFLWVHRLIERNADGTAGVVELDVPASLDVFRGHFPGKPIFPGVLQVEAVAQACLWAHLGELPEGTALPDVLFVGINEYKFRRPVVPPATLRFQVKELKVKSGLRLWEVAVYSAGQLVSGGTLWLHMVSNHQPNAKKNEGSAS